MRRNGNRWQVTAINHGNGRIAAQRLDDHTLAVFGTDYVREHITHGYAVTGHTAQGVTADTTHAVLAERNHTVHALRRDEPRPRRQHRTLAEPLRSVVHPVH
jgi:hypothetical protein